MNYGFSLAVLLPLCAAFSGCKESRATLGSEASPIAAASASAAATAARSQITQMVFIDKQEACNCTRARVTKAWDAMQGVLGGRAVPSVTRLYMDTQAEQVQKYRAMRPMMAVPALYFLSADGALVEQLQGEITAEQIQAVLGAK